MKKVLLLFVLLTTCMVFAEVKDLGSTAEFEKVIQNAKVPVVVKFSAYWCSSCQKLKKTMAKITPSYSDKQVLICTIDAYVNSDLKKYLMGGYPTVRVFYKGKMVKNSFVGNKDDAFIRQFLNSVINESRENTVKSKAKRQVMKEMKSIEELNKAISSSSHIPVLVKFSAFF